MAQFMNGLYNLTNTFSPLVYLLVAVALIIIGVMFVIPSEKSHEKAKSALPFVVIGCGLVLGATVLATEISSNFVFNNGGESGRIQITQDVNV